MGSEDFPVSIDGQPVYRLDDRGTWQSLSGSFLVAAGAPYGAPSCPAASPLPTAEADLLGQCPEVILFQTSGFMSGDGRGMGTAPKSLSLQAVAGWGGRIIVVRAHTHDPEAAQCGAAVRAGCEAALVVEAVVWPSVPGDIDGELVYRGRDVLGGLLGPGRSFLLGGLVRVQAIGPVARLCATSTAALQLVPYCSTSSALIDGVGIAPDSVVQGMDGRVVVVRAHVAVSLAAQCPADVIACEQAVVVESVVWSSKPYSTTGSAPLPTPTGTP
jgi:hypothetical protein